MKILMLGDYSNLHACLANELRKLGHEVTLVSDKGVYMQTDADVELRRHPGIFESFKYLYRILSLLPSWSGYDVVQLINPGFLDLKPGKLRMVFDILKKNNRSVFLTLCGNDHFFVKDCIETDLFRFSEFRIGKEKTALAKACPMKEKGWTSRSLACYTKHLYDSIDGAMAVLPEYYMSAQLHMDPQKLAFTNLPIEIENLPYTEMNSDGPVRILVGMRANMEIQKGTAQMLEICRELEAEMPGQLEVKAVRNLSLADYLEELKKSHIVIDQLYSYSPATNALQTMALGRVTASGAQQEYLDYVEEPESPVFCLSPLECNQTIKKRLRRLISDKEGLMRRAKAGRLLVERHNDVRLIAPLFEEHWKKHMQTHGSE